MRHSCRLCNPPRGAPCKKRNPEWKACHLCPAGRHRRIAHSGTPSGINSLHFAHWSRETLVRVSNIIVHQGGGGRQCQPQSQPPHDLNSCIPEDKYTRTDSQTSYLAQNFRAKGSPPLSLSPASMFVGGTGAIRTWLERLLKLQSEDLECLVDSHVDAHRRANLAHPCAHPGKEAHRAVLPPDARRNLGD